MAFSCISLVEGNTQVQASQQFTVHNIILCFLLVFLQYRVPVPLVRVDLVQKSGSLQVNSARVNFACKY